jgi:hypothetical protein
VVVAVAGCATTEMLVVPDSDYARVPAVERTKLDGAHVAAKARADAELNAAIAAATPHATPARTAPPAAQKPLVDDVARAARTRVDAAQVDSRRAELAWRRARVEVARARIEVVDTEREHVRARAVDRHIEGDNYQVAPYRGQLARAQERWYAATARADALRAELARTGAELASAKEAYAQIVRADGQALVAKKELELPSWSTGPTDTGHRRGLKFVSTTATLSLHQNGLGHRGSSAPLLHPK